MNLNGDEKRIRQLFREMSRDDQRRAPEFAGLIEAARSTTTGSGHRPRLFVLAPAVAALGVLLIAVSFAVQYSKQISKREAPPAPPARIEDAGSTLPIEPTNSVSVPLLADKHVATERPRIIKRIARRKTPDELASCVKSLSSWQSPTASLLKTPGEEMFKSLPRLGESLHSIKSFSPDQLN